MMQCGLKQSYFTIASLESKSTCDSLQEISYTQKILHFLLFFSCSLCKYNKWEMKIRALSNLMREKEIQQAGSEGAFPSLSLSVIKLKRFVNDSDSKEKENENIVDVTEWLLTSHVQQNEINKIDNDSDS